MDNKISMLSALKKCYKGKNTGDDILCYKMQKKTNN